MEACLTIRSELCLEPLGDATGEVAGDWMGEPAQFVSTELLEGYGYFSDGQSCCCSLDCFDRHLEGMMRGMKVFQPRASARMPPPRTMTRTMTTTTVVIRLLILAGLKETTTSVLVSSDCRCVGIGEVGWLGLYADWLVVVWSGAWLSDLLVWVTGW